MTDPQGSEALSDQPTWDIAKARQCLRCEATFPSEWSGERICTRCKSSYAWRNSAPFRARLSGNGR